MYHCHVINDMYHCDIDMYESCHTDDWVMYHIMSHVTQMTESCITLSLWQWYISLMMHDMYHVSLSCHQWYVSLSLFEKAISIHEGSYESLPPRITMTCINVSMICKEPLNIGHFYGKWPIKIRDLMTLCYPVSLYQWHVSMYQWYISLSCYAS